MSEEIIKGVLLMLSCIVPPIIIIAYDKFKYRHFYKRKFVYVMSNTELDRKYISDSGLTYSIDCKRDGTVILYAYLGSRVVCGLGSSTPNLKPKEIISKRIIEERRSGNEIISCGGDIIHFVTMVKNNINNYEKKRHLYII